MAMRPKRTITVNLSGKDLSAGKKGHVPPVEKSSQADLDLKALEKIAQQRGTTLAQEIARIVQGLMDDKKK